MNRELLIEISQNITLLLAATFLFSLLLRRFSTLFSRPIIFGVFFGLISTICMLLPIQVVPGVIFDLRVIVVAMAGFLMGPLTGLIAFVFPSAYRFYLGGVGTFAGVMALLCAAILGGLFHHLLIKRRGHVYYWYMLILGELIALSSLGCVFFLPQAINPLSIFLSLLRSVPLMYPVGALFFGFLIYNEKERVDNQMLISEKEQRYRDLFEDTPISLWEEDFSGIKNMFDAMKRDNPKLRVEDLFVEDNTLLHKCASMVRVLDVNSTSVELHRSPDKETLLRCIDQTFVSSSFLTFQKELEAIFEGSYFVESEGEIKTLTGDRKSVVLKWFVPHSFRGDYSRVIIALLDITELTEAREQLQHGERMKAIGQLAGGIAHDFNNILGGIMGFAEILQTMYSQEEEAREFIDHILVASERARNLVKRIMTFSRQKNDQFMRIDLYLVVDEVLGLLKATLPSSIELTTNFKKKNCPTLGDSTQIHEVVMNLCKNCVDAMEGKGSLSISLSSQELVKPVPGILGTIEPGGYLVLEIADTGHGISPDDREHIFEPFFTTKSGSGGTGLGLAMTYGVMKAHKGNITLESQVGVGTLFKLYFNHAMAERALSDRVTTSVLKGTERILFVDDDPLVYEMGRTMLTTLGYQVTPFKSSVELLGYVKNNSEGIDLIFTDQTMPQLTGVELAREVKSIDPTIPIVISTGFSSSLNRKEALREGVKAIVDKPYSMGRISKVIRDVLDSH